MVGKEKRIVGHVRRKDDRRKHVVKAREEESPTELDDEPTPFKKVMGMKGKVFVKDTKQTTMPKGKRWALVVSEDSITESDNEPSFWKKATVALAKPTQVSKDPTVVNNLTAGSTTQWVEHVLAKTRPKTKPASGHPAPSATTHVPITKTSKLTSKLNCSNNSDIDVKSQKLPQPSMSKSKSSEPKTEAAKVKEALRDVQEAFKKAREEARRVKEIAKEPGVHDQIKVLNKEANAEPGQLHPTCLSQLPKGKIIRTYWVKGQATLKLNRKERIDDVDIFNFRTDDNYDAMDIDDAELAKKIDGSGIGKKAGVRSGEQGDGKVEKGDTQKQVTATIYDTLCY